MYMDLHSKFRDIRSRDFAREIELRIRYSRVRESDTRWIPLLSNSEEYCQGWEAWTEALWISTKSDNY